MNKDKDQASLLRERMEKREGHHDMLNLPPRSKVHDKVESKQKRIKMKHPIIRFLLLCFLLVPIVFFMYTYYGSPLISNDKKGYEKVNVKENNKITIEKPQIEKPNENKGNNKVNQNKSEIKEGAEKPKGDNYTYHTVVSGETLYTISMKYYETRDGESYIRNINELNSNEVKPGQLLKIPSKADIGLK